jgi:hypothetical protein
MDRAEEIGCHGAAEGVKRLIFDGADLNDAGVVDEEVDVAEVPDGMVDEAGGLSGVGEVGRDEENVVRRMDGAALQQETASAIELFEVAGGEDKASTGAAKALGDGEAEAAGASGDHDDSATAAGSRAERPECGRGSGSGEKLEG